MGQHKRIYLTQQQRTELAQLLDGTDASVREKKRAQALLLSDRSTGRTRTDREVAEIVRCSPGTVSNLKQRYLADGLPAALFDKPRPGAAPKVTGEVEAQLTLLACSDPPPGQARWTLRLLAQQLIELDVVESISHVTVGEVLKKTSSSRGA